MELKKKYVVIIIVIIIFNLVCSTIFLYDYFLNASDEHTQYVLYVGLDDKDTGVQELSNNTIKNIVDNTTVKYVDGFTFIVANGYWLDNSTVFNETTVIIYIDNANIDTVHKIADELKLKLNQKSILIEKHNVDREFY